MECFLRETELLAAARFRSGLVRAVDYLAPAVSDNDDFAPGLTGFFEDSGVYPDFPLRISRASKSPLQGGSSSARGQHERA